MLAKSTGFRKRFIWDAGLKQNAFIVKNMREKERKKDNLVPDLVCVFPSAEMLYSTSILNF